MIRDVLGSDPTLAASLQPEAVPPILSPFGGPHLDADAASGLDLILEGFLAHHGTPRHLKGNGARNVLAGDFCYATGLARVAEAGDVEVIRLLADLVARSAGLAAASRHDLLPALWGAVMDAVADAPGPTRTDMLHHALTALDAGDEKPLHDLAARGPHRPGLQEAFA